MISFAGNAQEAELNNKLPFLDLCIHVKEDGGTKITIYRKPNHTDQYLNFSSNHPLEHKRSVVRTFTHRAKEFVTTSEDQQCELKHVHNALRTNGYTEWALVVPKQKPKTKPKSTNKGNTRPPSIGLPYVQGLSERLSKTFRQHGVSVYHKPVNTLRSILVHPKDKTPKDKKCGGHIRDNMRSGPCTRVHLGETKRPLGKRFKEHTNLTIPTVGDHCNATRHSVSLDDTKVLTREPQWTKRQVTEAIYIKRNSPSMNREEGYQLPPIYHQLLLPEQFPRKK